MTDGRLETLRCSDQDRELVAQVLNTAYADGRLTFDEHADRIAQAYDAKTFGELSKLTVDLVAAEERPPAPSTPPAPLAPSASGAYRGGNALFSSMRPGQISLLDSEVTLNAWLGDVKLDLVGAQYVSPETVVHIGGMMCDVKIRVPEGVSVDTSGITLILGDSKADGIVPGSVNLKLVGTLIMGDLKIYGPAMANQRKYTKFAR